MSVPNYRVVLIGKTGNGKSATGNSILCRESNEEDVFVSSAGANGVTKECELKLGYNAGVSWNVVDTPGVCDISTPPDVLIQEILRCIDMTTPGPHAIIMVTKIGRFTKEDLESFEIFFDRFGPGMYNHALVLFTGKDSLVRSKSTLEKYISEAGDHLKKILGKVNNRCVVFNNWEDDTHKRETQVEELSSIIAGMTESNQDSYFSDDAFKLASDYKRRKQVMLELIQRHEQIQKLRIGKEELIKHLFCSSAEARSKTVDVIREMAVEFDKCIQKDRKLAISGSTIAIIGTALTIAAGAVTIATMGAGVPFLVGSLMWTGFGVGMLGGAISLSSQVISSLKERELKESLILALNFDEDQNKKLQRLAADPVFLDRKFMVTRQMAEEHPLQLNQEQEESELDANQQLQQQHQQEQQQKQQQQQQNHQLPREQSDEVQVRENLEDQNGQDQEHLLKIESENLQKDILKLTEVTTDPVVARNREPGGQELSLLVAEILPGIEAFEMPDEQLNKVFAEVKKFTFLSKEAVEEGVKGGVKGATSIGARIGEKFGWIKMGLTGAKAAGGMAIGLGVVFAALDGYTIYNKATKESFGEPLRKIANVLESKMFQTSKVECEHVTPATNLSLA